MNDVATKRRNIQTNGPTTSAKIDGDSPTLSLSSSAGSNSLPSVVSPCAFNFRLELPRRGNEIEKIHPATYLLFSGLCISLAIDQKFRLQVVSRVARDLSLVSFTVAIIGTATYSIFIQGVSAAPFIDTFFAAIMATIVVTCIP